LSNPRCCPDVAVIVAVPAETPVAIPVVAIVATEVLFEIQFTVVLISRVVLSENVPVAIKVFVDPINIEAVVGVIAIETKVLVVTIIVVVIETLPDVAVMVAVPAETPVTMPVVAIVAMPLLFEDQLTVLLISRLEPSEKTPVATKFCVWPLEIDAAKGVMPIELKVASITVNVVVSEIPAEVAVIEDEPIDTDVAIPVEEIVAFALLEVQVTVEVISLLVPSEKVPVAVNVRVKPFITVVFEEVTEMEVNVAVGVVPPISLEEVLEPPPPHEIKISVIKMKLIIKNNFVIINILLF
jgi:hypothetical protein